MFKVHILVGMMFLDYDKRKYDRKNIQDSLVIDHLDGDKTNNKVTNLEVVTQAENIKRYYKSKVVAVSIKENLLDKVEQARIEKKMTRSRYFVEALKNELKK